MELYRLVLKQQVRIEMKVAVHDFPRGSCALPKNSDVFPKRKLELNDRKALLLQLQPLLNLSQDRHKLCQGEDTEDYDGTDHQGDEGGG
jgi:hypothetical protein